MLSFDPDTHIYRWNGRPVSSVTQVLKEWQEVDIYGTTYFVNVHTGRAISAETFRNAGAFGRAVHTGAFHILMSGGLNWNKLHPSLLEPLRQFEKWARDYKVDMVAVEKPLYSGLYGYAGTPDIICRANTYKLLVCDIKTGGYDLVGPQTAAYEQLYRESERYRGHIGRALLYLPKDGGPYQFKALTKTQDWAFFKVKLYEAKWRKAA